MKRIISMALILVLTLSLCACGGQGGGSTAKAGLQVGFGREDITPDAPVLIGGGGDPNRVSTGTLDPLTVTCVAITDSDDNTFLLITQDTVNSDEKFSTAARDKVSQATGIPADNIVISATHTHSAGALTGTGTGVQSFAMGYYDGIVRAAKKAMTDRSAATASSGTAQAENLVFVRRYYLDDGTVQGASGNKSTSTTITGHVYDANETIQIIRFTREGNKKDVLLTNLGAHATFNGATNLTNISADFPAGIRNYVENQGECLVAYFIGAGADQTPTTEIPSEDHGLNYFAYGEKIGQIICDALPGLQEVKTGSVKVSTQTHVAKTNAVDSARLADAQSLWGRFKGGEGFAVCEAAAKEAGYAGIYECMALVNRAMQKETRNITVKALSVGDLSFIAAPYEMYGITAADIISRSPYQNTFIMTCANGAEGYIPSAKGYELNTYEAYNSWMAPGTGEDLADLFVQMLTDMKA